MLHTPLSPPPLDAHAVPSPWAEGRARQTALRRSLRRRAIVEALVVALAALLAGLLPADPQAGLLAGLALLSVGLLLFVIRRGQDLSRLARLAQAERHAVSARGIPLDQWQSGAPLPAWRQRG